MLMFYLSALDTPEERDRLAYLYEKYYRLLNKTALKILGAMDFAEDAVHETFLAAIEGDQKIYLQDEVNFRNWSVIVVKNKCYDIIRRKKKLDNAVRLDADNASELESNDLPLDIQITNRDDYEKLLACIEELEPMNRQILEMKYVLEMPFEKICSELNMTFPQVNGRLARTRAKIKEMFEKEGRL